MKQNYYWKIDAGSKINYRVITDVHLKSAKNSDELNSGLIKNCVARFAKNHCDFNIVESKEIEPIYIKVIEKISFDLRKESGGPQGKIPKTEQELTDEYIAAAESKRYDMYIKLDEITSVEYNFDVKKSQYFDDGILVEKGYKFNVYANGLALTCEKQVDELKKYLDSRTMETIK